MNSRPRLLAIGYGVFGTGLTRVADTILRGLSDRYEIQQVGLCYHGPPRDDGYRLLPSNLKGGDLFGVFQGVELIEQFQPEIVFIMHDVWQIANYTAQYRRFRDRLRIVTHIPFDGNVVNPDVCLALADVDVVVVYSAWAGQEVSRALQALRACGKIQAVPRIEVIGLWVDTSVFRPLPQLIAADFNPRARAAAKATVFPDLPDPEDSFIVLNASRPGVRKRVDLTMHGFARFARGKPPNVRLCLHQALGNEQSRQAHLRKAERLGIRERLIMDPLQESGPVSDTHLNLLYNACDVGINTSMGEGWGLVSFEHAAAGAPQIVPRHSACAELWEGAAEFLEPVARGVPSFSSLQLQTVSSRGVAAALERLYRDTDRQRELAALGREHARKPEFHSPRVIEQWGALFSSLVHDLNGNNGRHVQA